MQGCNGQGDGCDTYLDAAPPGVDVSRIRGQLLQIPRVIGVGALHVWMVDDGDVAGAPGQRTDYAIILNFQAIFLRI